MAVFSTLIKAHCSASSAFQLHFRGGTRDPSATLCQPERAVYVRVCLSVCVSVHINRGNIPSPFRYHSIHSVHTEPP